MKIKKKKNKKKHDYLTNWIYISAGRKRKKKKRRTTNNHAKDTKLSFRNMKRLKPIQKNWEAARYCLAGPTGEIRIAFAWFRQSSFIFILLNLDLAITARYRFSGFALFKQSKQTAAPRGKAVPLEFSTKSQAISIGHFLSQVHKHVPLRASTIRDWNRRTKRV